MTLSPRVYTALVGAFAAMGAALFGYDLAVIASVFVSPDFLRVTNISATSDADANWRGFIVSSMLLGAFVGSLPAGFMADRFSRRFAISFAAAVFLLGGALQTGANSRGMMLAGRFFAGWSIGGMGTLIPLYQSEIAHPARRGAMLSTFQFSLGIGAFVAGWITYGTAEHNYGTALQWRLPLAFQMLPAIPLVFLSFILPESPRWLLIKGRETEALEVLAKLHARGDTNDAFIQGEFSEMKLKLVEENAATHSWGQILASKQNMRKIMMGIALQFSVQMTGVSAIQYYSTVVYQSVGFNPKTTLLIQSLNNVNGLIFEGLCILFLDSTGRRFPLIYANAASGIAFAVATPLARQFAVGKGSRGQGIGFVAMTFIYNAIFSYGVGPLSWVYPVEIMNTSIRAKGSAISAMSSWIANFMIGQVSPYAWSQIGWRYYLVFTVCGISNAVFFWAFYPETKGRTLEEMDQFFDKNSWFIPGTEAAKGVKYRENDLAAGRLPEDGLEGSSGDLNAEKAGGVIAHQESRKL